MGRGASPTAELIELKGTPKPRSAKTGHTKAKVANARAAKAKATKAKAAKAKAAKAAHHKAGLLEREFISTRRTLRVYDDFIELADNLPDKSAEDARGKAWRAVDDADPVRVMIAEQLLQVSGQTVREWIEKGVLDAVEGSPTKVTLASVLETKDIVDELRELGQDRDLVSAVLNRLELEELEDDDRFRKSLEQMKRGERGELPARYGL
jgi:hypothetical protein